jgi:hypothetical protein
MENSFHILYYKLYINAHSNKKDNRGNSLYIKYYKFKILALSHKDWNNGKHIVY